MLSKHTLGPWYLTLDDNDHNPGWIKAPSGSVTEYAGCGTHSCNWPNAGDIALVLAAPELLKALVLYHRKGHHATCSYMLSTEHDCDCGYVLGCEVLGGLYAPK